MPSALPGRGFSEQSFMPRCGATFEENCRRPSRSRRRTRLLIEDENEDDEENDFHGRSLCGLNIRDFHPIQLLAVARAGNSFGKWVAALRGSR